MRIKQCLFHLLRTWERQPAVQGATLSALCGAFIVMAISMLMQQNLDHLITQWGSEVKINVYLNPGIEEKARADIRMQIEKEKIFEDIHFISKEDAVKRFQKRLGSMAPTFFGDGEFENPLPESYEMILEKNADTMSHFSRLVQFSQKLKSFAGVEEISYGQEWLKNYSSAVQIIRGLGWAFILIIAAGALLVIGNAIRSGVYQQRQEIEILELFGATRSMIMTPFIFEGAVLGFFAAAVSLFVTYALYSWFLNSVGEGLNFWNLKAHVSFLSLGKALFFTFICTSIGALGSYMCVKQVSTGWAAAEARKS